MLVNLRAKTINEVRWRNSEIVIWNHEIIISPPYQLENISGNTTSKGYSYVKKVVSREAYERFSVKFPELACLSEQQLTIAINSKGAKKHIDNLYIYAQKNISQPPFSELSHPVAQPDEPPLGPRKIERSPATSHERQFRLRKNLCVVTCPECAKCQMVNVKPFSD
ncbi:hypothetical protein NQ318_012926 [Aromia moschata]|uniref:AD domain-containing protein n=1 Tax=Aromia moschata TaxID=1265417 RepID=A0AAV8XMP0_9CUCU|nr:hypothetical protein NQ318_012926 [Aromia moschata]